VGKAENRSFVTWSLLNRDACKNIRIETRVSIETNEPHLNIQIPEGLLRKYIGDCQFGLFDAITNYQRYDASDRPRLSGNLIFGEPNLDSYGLLVCDQQVMQYWEFPVMRKMVELLSITNSCRVLEVGYGLGLSASEIQSVHPQRHVILEPNRKIADMAREWADPLERDIHIIEARWQDFEPEEQFDAIFFDVYPNDESEIEQNLINGSIAAEHFFELASLWLKSGGRFTFWTGCRLGIPTRVQHALFELFGSVMLREVRGLRPPKSCNYWSWDTMVTVVAVKD